MSLLTQIYEISKAEEKKYKGKFPYPLKKFGSKFGPKARRMVRDLMKKGMEKERAIPIMIGTFSKAGIDPKKAK